MAGWVIFALATYAAGDCQAVASGVDLCSTPPYSRFLEWRFIAGIGVVWLVALFAVALLRLIGAAAWRLRDGKSRL